MENKSNERLELARRIIEKTGTSLFLTGKAGTGKTTFLRNLRTSSRKRMVVCAPTGIAAINAGGVTLHSFFQLDFSPFIPGVAARSRQKFNFSKDKLKIIRGMDLLVIDEVSMVRADLMDAVDDVLRRLRDRTKPFGGVQLLLIGDLQQLAPVLKENERHLLEDRYKSMFFFDSLALQQMPYETIELNEVFRQKDSDFLGLLNAIREDRADKSVLDRLNSRYIPDFNPADDEGYIRLTTHNDAAAKINDEKLQMLPTQEHVFECHVEGKFPETSYPADSELRLKVGAQVMFIKNDVGMERAYYNGMIGQVEAIDEEHGVAVRPQEGGALIHVMPVEWDNVSYTVDPATKEIVEHREGSFTQFPLKLAWAVTIHKSQGLTFDRAIIDVKRSFAHGQAYVALSRCRTLNGMVLSNPIPPYAIINDKTVNRFMVEHNCDEIDEEHLNMLERQYKVNLLDDLFNFRQMFAAMEGMVRLYQENFLRKFPAIVQNWVMAYEKYHSEINKVADTFRNQYSRLAMDGSRSEEVLQDRVKAACKYFTGQLAPLASLAVNAIRNSDNKSVKTKLLERLELFEDVLTTKRMLLNAFATKDFDTDVYLDLKARVMLRDVTPKTPKKGKAKAPRSVKDLMKNPDASVVPGADELKSPAAVAVLDETNKPGNKVKEKKGKAAGTPKVPSSQISLELYRKGYSIPQIAEARGLVTGTVTSHLLKSMSQDELGQYIDKYVAPDVRRRMERYLASTSVLPGTWTELRDAMGGAEWEDLHLLMKYHNRELTRAPKPEVSSPVADVTSYTDPHADIMSDLLTLQEPTAPYGSPTDFIEEE